MKIIHVIFSFTPDGAETMLVDVINEQIKTEKVKLIIINNLFNKDLIQTINKKAIIFCLKRAPGSFNPFKIIKLNYEVFNYNPDVIHFHSHNAIGLIFFLRNISTFLTIHGLHRPLKYFSKYKSLFSISNAVKEDIMRRGSFNSKVIYNGIDFSIIKSNRNYTSQRLFKIVVVSRLCHEIKGQDILLRALHHLIYSKGITNLQLDLIGEGPSLNNLHEITIELNIEKYVNFLGLKDRNFIYNHLKDFSLLVQPSIHEGFGLTIVEGMAAKIPVLVSDIDGPLEIIDHGKYGYLFTKGNPLSCAEGIEKILRESADQEKFNNALDRAYQFAFTNFSIQKTAYNYLKEYYKLP